MSWRALVAQLGDAVAGGYAPVGRVERRGVQDQVHAAVQQGDAVQAAGLVHGLLASRQVQVCEFPRRPNNFYSVAHLICF